MMKVYIASKFGNRLLIRLLIETGFFEEFGIEINSSWLYKTHVTTFRDDISLDFKEIDECDFLIAPYYWIDGAKNEICYAMGKNKPIIALIDDISYSDASRVRVGEYSKFFPLALFCHVFASTEAETFYDKKNYFVIANNPASFKNAIKIAIDVLKKKREKK